MIGMSSTGRGLVSAFCAIFGFFLAFGIGFYASVKLNLGTGVFALMIALAVAVLIFRAVWKWLGTRMS
jgi:hypothetical protein